MKIVSKNYYTITAVRKEKQLKTKGLVSTRDGEIFLFNKLKVGNVNLADHLAVFKFKLDAYLLVTVKSKGIHASPQLQETEGLTAGCEYHLFQKLIESDYLEISNVKKPDTVKLMQDTLAYGIKIAKKKKRK